MVPEVRARYSRLPHRAVVRLHPRGEVVTRENHHHKSKPPKPLVSNQFLHIADILRELGQVAAGSRPLYGAAIIKAAAVRNAALDVISSEPPERHALIQGWAWIDNDPEQQKAQQKERALLLASIADSPLIFDR